MKAGNYVQCAIHITENSCEFDYNKWKWVPNFQFPLLITILKIQKFFREFVLIITRSTDFFLFRYRCLIVKCLLIKTCIEIDLAVWSCSI